MTDTPVKTIYYYGKKVWDCTNTPTGYLTKNKLKPGEIIMLSKKKVYQVSDDMSWRRLKGKAYKEFNEVLK